MSCRAIIVLRSLAAMTTDLTPALVLFVAAKSFATFNPVRVKMTSHKHNRVLPRTLEPPLNSVVMPFHCIFLLFKDCTKQFSCLHITRDFLVRSSGWSRSWSRTLWFLPARRYASAGLCDSDVSVCLSVRLSHAGIVPSRAKAGS